MQIDHIEQITGAEPISVDYAKKYCRVDFSFDDEIIEQAISAAREVCEAFIDQSIVSKTITAQFWNFDQGDVENSRVVIPLPFGPVRTIDEVKTINSEAQSTTLTSNQYNVFGLKQKRITVGQPYSLNQQAQGIIQVQYKTGFTSVPKGIKDGIAQLVGDMYEHRQNEVMGDAREVFSIGTAAKLKPFKVTFG